MQGGQGRTAQGKTGQAVRCGAVLQQPLHCEKLKMGRPKGENADQGGPRKARRALKTKGGGHSGAASRLAYQYSTA